ncbi:MAG: folate-binding protein [Alphaproteobacteria bacterium]|nr:folate-binding protein [Alphaproteobacteria bacterium]MDX5494135.1 folate-binding protein [Alphaproteobacteria bacterium]
MTGAMASRLSGRGIVRIGGPEARSFLQGLVTNNVDQADGAQLVYAALLTPQGKFLFDFFMAGDPADPEAVLLDCDGARAGDLVKRLSMYKLRAKVEIEDRSGDFAVIAYWNEDGSPMAGGPGLPDPRHPQMGRRAIVPEKAADTAMLPEEAWHRHRISLGIGEAAEDFEPDRTFPLEVNFAELNGIDFHKGCFVGQEVTSRTKRRGSVRKRLLPVHVEGDMPEPGTPVKGGVREVGTIHSTDARSARALALLRLDLIGGAVLEAGQAEIRPEIPGWLEASIESGRSEESGGDGD